MKNQPVKPVQSDVYEEPESERRFRELLKSALKTPPQHLKDKPQVRKPPPLKKEAERK